MTNVLVITGGSRGIGEKTIKEFIAHDWHIINISRSDCHLEKVTNLHLDLTQKDWDQSLLMRLTDLLAKAEQICLVHNAASYKQNSVKDLSPDALRDDLEINLVAPVKLNTLLLPFMKNQSSIIYIGSTLSEIAVPNRASYTISKHALVGLMRATVQDLAGLNIHTCCICPGFVNTLMLTDAVEIAQLNQLVKNKVTSGRLIEPEEIAEVVYFAATHPVINGAVMHANLGQISS